MVPLPEILLLSLLKTLSDRKKYTKALLLVFIRYPDQGVEYYDSYLVATIFFFSSISDISLFSYSSAETVKGQA